MGKDILKQKARSLVQCIKQVRASQIDLEASMSVDVADESIAEAERQSKKALEDAKEHLTAEYTELVNFLAQNSSSRSSMSFEVPESDVELDVMERFAELVLNDETDEGVFSDLLDWQMGVGAGVVICITLAVKYAIGFELIMFSFYFSDPVI